METNRQQDMTMAESAGAERGSGRLATAVESCPGSLGGIRRELRQLRLAVPECADERDRFVNRALELYRDVRAMDTGDEGSAVIRRLKGDCYEVLRQNCGALVHSICRPYLARLYPETRTEVIEAAFCGLYEAMQRFDLRRGNAFSTFAVPTIRGSVRKYYRGRTLGFSALSLQERAREDGPSPEETVQDERAAMPLDNIELNQTLTSALRGRRLTERDMTILADQLGVTQLTDGTFSYDPWFDKVSQQATGSKLGISQMHVSRLTRQLRRELAESRAFSDYRKSRPA